MSNWALNFNYLVVISCYLLTNYCLHRELVIVGGVEREEGEVMMEMVGEAGGGGEEEKGKMMRTWKGG